MSVQKIDYSEVDENWESQDRFII